MPVEDSDTIGIVIHVHGPRYTQASQQSAIETIGARAIVAIGQRDKEIAPRLPFPCPGRTYALLWLFLVNRKRGTAQRKRERIMAFVDWVREHGAEILEVGSGRRTDDTKQRRAMLSEALEAVTRGRQPSHTGVRGRQPRKLSDGQKDIMWREWFNVRNETNADAAAAASKRLGFVVDQFVIWHVVRDMRRAAGEPSATGASGRPFRKASKR